MTKSFIKKMFLFRESKEKTENHEQALLSCKTAIAQNKSDHDTVLNDQSHVNRDEGTDATPKTQNTTASEYGNAIEAASPPPLAESPKIPWFGRLKKGLALSSQQLGNSLSALFTKHKVDKEILQELEDILIQSDLGVEMSTRIINILASGRYEKKLSLDEIRATLINEIKNVLEPLAIPLELDLKDKPHVILLVGVNGSGKTTTIGKLASRFRKEGLNVMLAAGDTFRAAAIEQLNIWGERVKVPVISTKLGADSASLAFDAYEKAKKSGIDILIIDTAGRLQNKTELMDELAKIIRVLKKHNERAPHTVLQTLDATIGQNALSQVDIFHNVSSVNGLIMTKLDGTARGGILVAIAAKYKLPIHFIGIGENISDLEPFSASDFAEAIVGKYS